MKVTPLDLRQQKFKTVMRGYDRAEVEAFLNETAEDYEQALREIRDGLIAGGVPPGQLGELSMGMTHDFHVAVEEGATIVRVGTAIFGTRS